MARDDDLRRLEEEQARTMRELAEAAQKAADIQAAFERAEAARKAAEDAAAAEAVRKAEEIARRAGEKPGPGRDLQDPHHEYSLFHSPDEMMGIGVQPAGVDILVSASGSRSDRRPLEIPREDLSEGAGVLDSAAATVEEDPTVRRSYDLAL